MPPPSQAVLEEVEALASIYEEDGFSVENSEHATCVTVSIDGSVSCTFVLTGDYPATPPQLQIEGLPKGKRSELVARVTAACPPGEPCLFSAVEELRQAVQELADQAAEEQAAVAAAAAAAASSSDSAEASGARDLARDRGIVIVTSEPITVQKSTFQCHVAQISSPDDVGAVVRELLMRPHVARATHNILAWTCTVGGQRRADNDDDGEDAAGGRLAHLLELMHVENAVVVVSRWFGGVLMGPSRFKVINECARTHVEAQPWYKGRGEGK